MKDQLIKKIILMVGIIAVLGVASSAVVLSSPASAQKGPEFIPGRYIVVLQDGVSPQDVTKGHGLVPDFVYSKALNGFSALVTPKILNELKQDPRVVHIEQDQKVFAFDKPPHSHPTGDDSEQPSQPSQVLPTGVDRINADLSSTAAGNGGGTVDVDIAILDTGIAVHPDLNLFKKTNCAKGGPFGGNCKDGNGDDGNGHGTHVAGTAAAIDNGNGVVGVAPGAKLWAVKVLGNDGSGWMSWIIGGVDYVTAHANEIEVANMSLGCKCTSSALNTAIANSVAAGVVYAVAAGNNAEDAATFSPANHPDVITVSAITDTDGQGGGTGPTSSWGGADRNEDGIDDGQDDTFAWFSNFGSLIELAAPGVDILSTWLDGGYNTISGTSMASPHVAGAAALYMANNDDALSDLPADVRSALIAAGTPQTDSNGFTGDPDANDYPEPLLDAETL